jgi:hypothetical protein
MLRLETAIKMREAGSVVDHGADKRHQTASLELTPLLRCVDIALWLS